MAIKGVVDESVTINFKDSQDDPIDQIKQFVVKPAVVSPPRPVWLILPIGIVFGVIYLATRK